MHKAYANDIELFVVFHTWHHPDLYKTTELASSDQLKCTLSYLACAVWMLCIQLVIALKSTTMLTLGAFVIPTDPCPRTPWTMRRTDPWLMTGASSKHLVFQCPSMLFNFDKVHYMMHYQLLPNDHYYKPVSWAGKLKKSLQIGFYISPGWTYWMHGIVSTFTM